MRDFLEAAVMDDTTRSFGAKCYAIESLCPGDIGDPLGRVRVDGYDTEAAAHLLRFASTIHFLQYSNDLLLAKSTLFHDVLRSRSEARKTDFTCYTSLKRADLAR